MSDDPQSTIAWARGVEGERRLAGRLNDELADSAVVLHDRKVPRTRGNIDHLVVAPSGIWIIDAMNHTGRVEQRDVGGWLASNLRLYVGGRNQTKLVEGLSWQVRGVRAMLEPIGFGEAPIHAVLCFTNSDWGLFAKPFRVNGAQITWPNRLIERVQEPGPFDVATIALLARELSSKLPVPSADRA